MARTDARKTGAGKAAGRETKPEEEELVRKLPEKTDPAQERGERIATGKAIATGGGSERRPPSDRRGEGAD